MQAHVPCHAARPHQAQKSSGTMTRVGVANRKLEYAFWKKRSRSEGSRALMKKKPPPAQTAISSEIMLHIQTHTDTHRHTQTHTDTHTDTHRHTDTQTHTDTHTQTDKHAGTWLVSEVRMLTASHHGST